MTFGGHYSLVLSRQSSGPPSSVEPPEVVWAELLAWDNVLKDAESGDEDCPENEGQTGATESICAALGSALGKPPSLRFVLSSD